MTNEEAEKKLLRMLRRVDIFSILLCPSIHQGYILASKINDIVSYLRRNGGKGVPSQQSFKMALGQAEQQADRLTKLLGIIEEDFLAQIQLKEDPDYSTELFGNDVLISANQNLYLACLIHNACISDPANYLKIESMLKAMGNKPDHPSYIDPSIINEFNR